MSEPTRWRKKPVEVDAIQFDGENLEEVSDLTGVDGFRSVDEEDRTDDPEIVAEVWDVLHSTWVGVKAGQWIIRGVRGEFYPCDPEVFATTYEPVRQLAPPGERCPRHPVNLAADCGACYLDGAVVVTERPA
jgi:hypothetical protein